MGEETEKESKPHRFSAVIAVLLVLPLIYVLSIGPAAAVSEKFPSSGAAVREFYFPVIWMHDHTPLQQPLEVYVRLWGAH